MRTSGIRGTSRPGAVAVGLVTGVLALTAAACGSTTSATTPAAAAASPSHHAMPSHHTMADHSVAGSARFGSDCGMIPATGMGSFHGMSMDPVLTAASHNPLLTTFAHDAKAAGLTAQLNSMHAITVFAPANSAFAKLPASPRLDPEDAGGRHAPAIQDGRRVRGEQRRRHLREHPDRERHRLRHQQGACPDALMPGAPGQHPLVSTRRSRLG